MVDIPGYDYPNVLDRLVSAIGTFDRSPHWKPHLAWTKVALLDGTMAKGTLMRRHRGGGWQYRSLTDDEQSQLTVDRTW